MTDEMRHQGRRMPPVQAVDTLCPGDVVLVQGHGFLVVSSRDDEEPFGYRCRAIADVDGPVVRLEQAALVRVVAVYRPAWRAPWW